MRIRILTAVEVRRAIAMPAAIDAMADAFGEFSAGRARVPLRTMVPGAGGVTLLMPAFLERGSRLGTKLVSVYPSNAARGLPAVSGVVVVFDGETGQPLAVLDGTYLTALRTGAASGLATRLLARDDASVVALFGAGAQAATQLEAVRAVRAIAEVRIVARRLASAERFAAELRGVRAVPMSDAARAVRGADIIIAATSSAVPVFPGATVGDGTHINGIGSYTPEMQEVDADVVCRSAIVVDSRSAALAEAGDLLVPIRAGRLSSADIHAELGEIVNGTRPGRRTRQEITFFKSVGIAAQDVALAHAVVGAAERTGLGTVVELGAE